MGELNEVIDYWMNENTVNSAFSSNSKSKVRLMYEQVRFPLFGKGKFGGRQKALNAEGFIKSIGTFLAQFGLSISVTPIGIGKAYVMIGAK